MREIGASEFKAHCLALLDEIDDDGLVITKRGKPVARLTPIHAASASLIGALAGKLTVNRDILSAGVEWDAQS